MIVYHYSHAIHLDAILESGVLRPATIGVPRHEKPAVWFTINPVWEPTSGVWECDSTGGHLRGCSMQESHEMVGLIRFVVDERSAPFNWRDHKKLGGINRRTARALYNAAIEQGSCPTQYRLSYDPVPSSEWLAVEEWDGTRWQPIPGISTVAA